MITFTVPIIPIAKSNGYKRGRNSFYKSEDMREQEEMMRESAREQLPPLFSPYKGSIKATITIILPNKRRRDLDNITKIVFDALNNLLYLDDNQITEIHLYKQINKSIGPLTTITIEEIQL